MVSINISEEPNFTRPELLLHHQIPRVLAGVNPRTIEGPDWWDTVRKEAYKRNHYCCWACGTHRLDTSDQLLDCHERYEYDYDKLEAHFTGVAALCRLCHQFIHYYGMPNWNKLKKCLMWGLRTLHKAGLSLPSGQVQAARYWRLTDLPFLDTAKVEERSYRTAMFSRNWKLVYKGKKYPRSPMHAIVERIKGYYQLRGLKWPTTEEALMWLQTELAEVYELLLAKAGGWIRNNPDSKEVYIDDRLAEELGDVIMMAIVAGVQSNVDPITALLNKIQRKEGEHEKEPGPGDQDSSGNCEVVGGVPE